jgi:membrane dipeptidase
MNETRRRAVVADAHNDLLCAVVARPVERWGEYFREQWLPQLRAGGVDIQVLPVFIDRLFRPENSLRQTLRMIEAAHRIAEHNSDAVALCVDGSQIDSAVSNNRIALVLALEGTPGVADDIELFQTVYRLGVRMASLTHFGRSAFADGSAEDHTRSRLTAPGVAAVAEMERLGVVLDISHLGATGLDHVLEIATRPVVASHSSARAVYDHHRNLSDEHIRGVASTGGLICVNFYGPYIHQSERTLDRLVDHFEHITSVAGVEHVGIGSDFVQEAMHDSIPLGCERHALADTFIPGIEGPRGLPLVTEALRLRGWPEGDIAAVLGENLRAFLVDELTVPDPTIRRD